MTALLCISGAVVLILAVGLVGHIVEVRRDRQRRTDYDQLPGDP